MGTCYANDLISFNPCRLGLGEYLGELVRTQMFCNWYDQLINGGSPSCDVQVVLTQAKCFFGLTLYELKAVQAQLLCNILDTYTNPPVTNPEIDQDTGTQDIDIDAGPVFDRSF